MRILITGGLGYLGGRLAQLLAAAGTHELRLATRRTGVSSALPSVTVVTSDWSDERALRQLCEGMDAVIHLAGMNAADCAHDPVGALAFNGLATARLARALTHTRVGRFVYLSTAHVYGGALCGRVDELTLPRPRHAYGTSHLAGEYAARAADAVVARLSNAFGAPASTTTDCWSLVGNDLCRQAVTTGRAVLRSDGTQRRDFISVREACRAILHLLELPSGALGDGVFNVGGGWAPTVMELAACIAARVEHVLGCKVQVVAGGQRDVLGGQPLEYATDRLRATGFKSDPQASVNELDQLVQFCAQHYRAMT